MWAFFFACSWRSTPAARGAAAGWGLRIGPHATACSAYTQAMLWVKAFHIVFVMSWMAGLFYLPRILVNLAMVPADSPQERARLLLMGYKLVRFSTILAVPALLLGVWLWLGWGITGAWLHAKLVLVLGLVGYHHACARMLARFASNSNTRSHRWYRVFNEAVVLVVVAIVILVVVKPF